MTDTERITEIMRVKNLNNVQFCQLTGIATATLSHITGGRTNPSLSILRNVVSAFPDLNPNWIFMGTGDMFRSTDDDLTPLTPAEAPFLSTEKEPAAPTPPSAYAPLAMPQQPEPRQRERSQHTHVQPDLFTSPHAVTTPPRMPETNEVSLADILQEVRNVNKRPVRKITEIRIFFDDGTYESFGSK